MTSAFKILGLVAAPLIVAAAACQRRRPPSRRSIHPLPALVRLHRLAVHQRSWENRVRVVKASPVHEADLMALHRTLETTAAIPPGSRQEFQEWIAGRKGISLVATWEDKPVGVVSFHSVLTSAGSPCLFFSYLLIDPAWQRRGLGTLLMLAGLATAESAQDCILVGLQAIQNSRSFWRRMGTMEWTAYTAKDQVEYWTCFATWRPALGWRIRRQLASVLDPEVAQLSLACEPGPPPQTATSPVQKT